MPDDKSKGEGLLVRLKRLFSGSEKQDAARKKEAIRKALEPVKPDIDVLSNTKKPQPPQKKMGADVQEIALDIPTANNNAGSTVPLAIDESSIPVRKRPGICELYRKHTPFGIMKTNGKDIEIEHFDTRLLELLRQYRVIPVFESVDNHSIAGYYEIHPASLRLSNVRKFGTKNGEIVFGALHALVSRSVHADKISEEDSLAIDTLMLKIEDVLKK
ncbi:MAG: hypothetical protein N3G76_02290 [Candidatus Micrarchaeota archaeon]|nr:hypothetical protein [Candidatus Micrarchaeota archaeon]